MTGNLWLSLSFLRSSRPSILGILTSKTARSGWVCFSPTRAEAPSVYVRTTKPSFSRAMETDVSMF